eukprot:CAMPEP_0197518880 /NCGR_PEP_ID=MMETSP1318-20131121/4134_1 /TAXON_ID=552666 /ORGANISM="Partenskyella glossopodia, Strain RCC365" /LENGTH=102 /DNA_ID=CAMNT_0043069551 /DNA_START=333 /DNA_END=641 /DNA_ORIENTATION=-
MRSEPVEGDEEVRSLESADADLSNLFGTETEISILCTSGHDPVRRRSSPGAYSWKNAFRKLPESSGFKPSSMFQESCCRSCSRLSPLRLILAFEFALVENDL